MSLFRPCIDLHDGKVKQIVGSTLSDSESTVKTNFVAEHDSSWFAELYRRDGLTGGHVIKLGPGNDEAAKRALAAYPGGLQVGGGVTAENAPEWLAAGAGQVIVTSYIFADGELKRDRLEKLFRSTGRDRLVLDLSCRRLPGGGYRIVTDRWQKFTTLAVDAAALNQLADYACEFLVHAVDVEGRQSGICSAFSPNTRRFRASTPAASAISTISNRCAAPETAGSATRSVRHWTSSAAL